MHCGSCAATNPLHANYCNACGARLAPRPDFIDGERRHVTALFCDLVGSTEIAARLDPEQWHDIATHYRQAAAGEVVKYGGHVTQYLGDGLVAYFGYPEAREDAADRAVHAGLAIVRAMAGVNERHAAALGITLAVRVGLHSGSVVVARGGESEVGMFGDTPNIAARCQEAAAPDTVLMTSGVRNAISGAFLVEDLGTRTLKGIERPISLFRAVRAEARRKRSALRDGRKRTSFVGRTDEISTLLERHRRAADKAQIVLISGEPGIGKSRLLEEFRSEIKDLPHVWLEGGGEPLFANTPFRPVVQMLQQSLGGYDPARMEAASRLLRRALHAARRGGGEAFALIADLLGLPAPEAARSADWPPDKRRGHLLAALADWVTNASSGEHLLVLAIEDLHWVDPSTLELMQTIATRASARGVLIVATTRPDFRAPWPMQAHHTHVALSRLDSTETRAIIEDSLAQTAFDTTLLEDVIERAEGVPLFAEELARNVMERAETGPHEIPATLRDSLMARLDRLGPAKDTAQLAAVIGREFDYPLLRAVSNVSDDELTTALAILADADLLHAGNASATYRFKHALVRDAAYDALLKSQRRILHARVGRTIAQNFGALARAHPEILAHHWSEAGDFDQANRAWTEAGRALASRHAYKEAVDAYTRARAALTSLPVSVDRDARDLQLARWLVAASQIAFGYSAEETRAATQIARELSEKSTDTRKQFALIAGQWMAASSAGDYQYAALLAEQILPLATAKGTPDGLGTAYMILTTTRCRSGDLAGAEQAFYSGKPFFESPDYQRRPGAAAQAFGNGAVNALLIGEIAEARHRLEPVIQLARTSDNPYELAFSQYMAAWVAALLADFDLAKEFASKSIAQSSENHFPHFAAAASIVLGHALTALGQAEEGARLMLQGLRAQGDTHARSGITMYLTWLATAQHACGHTDQALATLEQALEINPHEVFYRPESLRLRGDYILQTGDRAGAAEAYGAAIELARKIGAGGLLARASTSLERQDA